MKTQLHHSIAARMAWAFSLIVFFAFALPSGVRAGTYTVTDASEASLRAAIDAANADPGAATIVFDIAGGGTITLTSMLPS